MPLTLNILILPLFSEVKLSSKLLNLFMDPTGSTTLVTLEGNDIVYLQPGVSKTKSLSKLKGNFITCMSWTPMGAVLFGTAKGDIMETEIIQDSNPYIKQVGYNAGYMVKL